LFIQLAALSPKRPCRVLPIIIFSFIINRVYHTTTKNLKMAAGQGLEPQYLPPEGSVLPLDEPAIICSTNDNILYFR
jgi:hypothetical protein